MSSSSRSLSSESQPGSDFRKDPNWKKLSVEEKDRLKRKVMKHYVSLHAKEEDLEAAKNIKKIKGLEKKIHKELDD